MGKRYSKSDLKQEIEEVNEILKNSGSSYHYELHSRSGYWAIDLYSGKNCVDNLDCAEPFRRLSERMWDDHTNYLGKTYFKD